jgi:hypothetical protein
MMRVVVELTKLKQRPGKNIAIAGSATLVRSLLSEGLVDEQGCSSSRSSWATGSTSSTTGLH